MKDKFVEMISNIAGALGFNKVRVRWKLSAWLQRSADSAAQTGRQFKNVGYKHIICPHCGALQDGETSKCSRCGRDVGHRSTHFLQRLGLAVPSFFTVSTLILFSCVVVYARMVMDCDEESNFFQMSGWTLVRFGGDFKALVQQGEYWRLGSSMFLHAGLLHLGFNMLALAQIGPQVEHALGRSRFLVLYVGTGLIASGVSYLFLGRGVGIGASGAIMGVIGAGAAFGHRLGTSGGREFRNRMVQWALYTMVFGLVVRADNWAHAGGFISGVGLAYVMYPAAVRRQMVAIHWILGAWVCLGLMGWFLYEALTPSFPVEFKDLLTLAGF